MDPQKAQEWFEKSLDIQEKLVAKEPENTELLRNLSICYYNLGKMDAHRNEHRTALLRFEAAVKIAEKPAAQNPYSSGFLLYLSKLYNRLGTMNECSDPQKARKWFEQALEKADKFLLRHQQSPMAWSVVASITSGIAGCLLEQGRLSEERDYSERAHQAMARAAELDPDDPEIQYGLACTWARLGEIDEALEALCRSVNLGYTDADHAGRDPDLRSLRGLPEFEAILPRIREPG